MAHTPPSNAGLLLIVGILGFVVWLGVTFLPIAAAIGCWRLGKHRRYGWIAHLVFVPGLLAAEWLLVDLLFFAAGDKGDGPPGLGLALIPAIVCLAVVVVAYYLKLATNGLTKLFRERRSA